ncbi:MAG: threonine aldolase family protein [Clostridia bacterium]
MLSFQNDYQEGAHEKILKRLMETNLEPQSGYGSDSYTESAKEKIRKVCECPQADVWFLTGGTQTNQNVIDAMLQPYEGVVAASTGHVSVHEAGAIEFTGHKVLTIPQHEGKIYAEELESYLRGFWEDTDHEHMVFPGMVYISHPTEYGTLYTRSELENISAICEAYDIPLYLDGARLGYGLMSDNTDVTLGVISNCCDVFYIGGTRWVHSWQSRSLYQVTRKAFSDSHQAARSSAGKGRLLGIQFDTLFTDDLYFLLGRHAIDMSELMKNGLKERGVPFYIDSPTNQQFLLLTNEQADRLKRQVLFSTWERPDEMHTVIRLATSWATTEENVQKLLQVFDEIM